jgi:hypothetical protein
MTTAVDDLRNNRVWGQTKDDCIPDKVTRVQVEYVEYPGLARVSEKGRIPEEILSPRCR